MKKHNLKSLTKGTKWALSITIITFGLAIFCSLISQIAVNVSTFYLPLLLLIFMIFISIIFDGIAVSVTSVDKDRLYYFKKDNEKVYNITIALVNNAEKVNNICADVVGDMCGILSGACGATLIVANNELMNNPLYPVLVSSLIVAITVGGKAYLKNIAVNNAEEYLVSVVKLISIFVRGKNENIRKN